MELELSGGVGASETSALHLRRPVRWFNPVRGIQEQQDRSGPKYQQLHSCKWMALAPRMTIFLYKQVVVHFDDSKSSYS